MNKPYILREAAELICGDTMKHPTVWLRRQIRTGRVKAYRVGRSVVMSEEQIIEARHALEIGGTTPQPVRSGPTAASLRRRQAS